MLGLGTRAEGTAALAGSREEAMLQRQVGYLLSGFWISCCRKLVLQVLGLPLFLCSCHPPWHCHKPGCTLVACSAHAHIWLMLQLCRCQGGRFQPGRPEKSFMLAAKLPLFP